MPFGPINTRAVFQRLVNIVANLWLNAIVLAYLDDILIPFSYLQGCTRNFLVSIRNVIKIRTEISTKTSVPLERQ